MHNLETKFILEQIPIIRWRMDTKPMLRNTNLMNEDSLSQSKFFVTNPHNKFIK